LTLHGQSLHQLRTPTDGEWVWGRLKPCLEAGGADVLIDAERFRAGLAVVGQMDATQDQAERHVLVITECYLASDACRHEMERALALDPKFTQGVVIPVRRDDHEPWPDAIAGPNPLYVDLRRDDNAVQWKLLLQACDATLGTSAPQWLAARDEIVRTLQRHDSVNLVVDNGVPWHPLLDEEYPCALQRTLLPDLKVIDKHKNETASRRGLLESILRALDVDQPLPDKPQDLVAFDRVLESTRRVQQLALTHCDQRHTARVLV
jgi:hypothetical protein